MLLQLLIILIDTILMLGFNVKFRLFISLDNIFILNYFFVCILLIIMEFLCTPLFFYLDFIIVICYWLGRSVIKNFYRGGRGSHRFIIKFQIKKFGQYSVFSGLFACCRFTKVHQLRSLCTNLQCLFLLCSYRSSSAS